MWRDSSRAVVTAFAAVVCAACSAVGDRRGAPASAHVVGRYGQAGCIASLELTAEGTYEALVLTGVTADGCGTMDGAGFSAGSWNLDRGMVVFVPMNEPPGIAVRFADAVGMPWEGGLLVVHAGREHDLPREELDDAPRPGAKVDTSRR